MNIHDFGEFKENSEDIIKQAGHAKQPQTIGGKRGNYVISGITMRQLAECTLRGMLDAGTEYNKTETENLSYDHLIDLIHEVEWYDNFDPIAIIQCAGCHVEKVLGIYPNCDKLTS